MHVLIISDYAFVSGGQAKVAIESAAGLAARGHRVTFFAAVGPVSNQLLDANVHVVCIGVHTILKDPNRLRGAWRALWNTVAASALKQLLDEIGWDVSLIHIHGWNQALSPSIGPIVIKSGIPHVYTMHEYFLHCPNGAFFNYKIGNHCELAPLSAACITSNCDKRSYISKLYRVGRQLGLRYVSRMPLMLTNFILLSRLQRRVLHDFERTNARYFQVANPITVARQAPVCVDKNKAYVFIGRLSREKGATLLAHAGKAAGVPLIFIGDGPCRAEVAAANPDAEITGWLSAEHVQVKLRYARVLVFPSIMYETFGLSVYEALASGVPVLVSDECAATEAVAHGETGLVFKRANEHSLTETMIQLKDADFAQRLGSEAYNRYWQTPLTLNAHVVELERVYTQIMMSDLKKDTTSSAAANPVFPVDHSR